MTEEQAFHLSGAGRAGRWLVTVDHATNRVPEWVNGGALGICSADMGRHIAYDVGALGLARHLAERLEAPMIASDFSRLVIDPNRGEDDPTLVMRLYDGTIIPANRHVDADEIARRTGEDLIIAIVTEKLIVASGAIDRIGTAARGDGVVLVYIGGIADVDRVPAVGGALQRDGPAIDVDRLARGVAVDRWRPRAYRGEWRGRVGRDIDGRACRAGQRRSQAARSPAPASAAAKAVACTCQGVSQPAAWAAMTPRPAN